MLRFIFIILTIAMVWANLGHVLTHPDDWSFVVAVCVMAAWYATWMRLATRSGK